VFIDHDSIDYAINFTNSIVLSANYDYYNYVYKVEYNFICKLLRKRKCNLILMRLIQQNW